jgi:hypothetical protein
MLRRSFLTLCVSSVLVLSSLDAYAEITADFKAKADAIMPQMSKWAADAAVVAAAKAGSPVTGMNNAKWSDLVDGDAIIVGLNSRIG